VLVEQELEQLVELQAIDDPKTPSVTVAEHGAWARETGGSGASRASARDQRATSEFMSFSDVRTKMIRRPSRSQRTRRARWAILIGA